MTTNNFMHTPLPQRRGTLQELEELFPEDVGRTTASRFRSSQDIAMPVPLLHQYALMTGHGVPGRFNSHAIQVGDRLRRPCGAETPALPTTDPGGPPPERSDRSR